jgi:DNA invertase Pin-like site-specific DNA recombinase
MTESEIKLVERLWESGKGVGEIARLLPYKEYIAKREIAELKRNGVLRGRSGKTKEKTWGKILQAYNGGKTNPYEIAEMLGLRVNTVNHVLSNLSLKRKRPRHNYANIEIGDKTKDILSEIKNGGVLSEIARKHGVSRQYVHKLKNKYAKREQNNDTN